MGWPTGRAPPVVLSIDRLGARIAGADVIAADVVLVQRVCGNGINGLRSAEQNTRARVNKPIAGKAVLDHSSILRATIRRSIPKARQGQAVTAITAKRIHRDLRALDAALQPVEDIVTESVSTDFTELERSATEIDAC